MEAVAEQEAVDILSKLVFFFLGWSGHEVDEDMIAAFIHVGEQIANEVDEAEAPPVLGALTCEVQVLQENMGKTLQTTFIEDSLQVAFV